MATPNVGIKAFTARRFGAGLGLGFGSVDSIFITYSDEFNKILNYYNAFTASVPKSVDYRPKFRKPAREFLQIKKQPTVEVAVMDDPGRSFSIPAKNCSKTQTGINVTV